MAKYRMQLNVVSFGGNLVRFAVRQMHMGITQITTSRWKLSGFVRYITRTGMQKKRG